MKRTLLFLLFLSLPMLLHTHTAQAQLDFQISLDTSGLPTGSGSGPYTLDFQLNGTHASTVALDHFLFGTGSVSGAPTYGGTASGSSATSIVLGPTSSSSLFNSFDQTFNPGAGSLLQFNLHLTPASGIPDSTTDAFIFGLSDASGTVQSTGDNGFEYATLDLPTGQTSFTVGSFRTFSYTIRSRTYAAQSLGIASSTPEPNGFVCLLALASMLLLMAGGRRWQKQRGANLPNLRANVSKFFTHFARP